MLEKELVALLLLSLRLKLRDDSQLDELEHDGSDLQSLLVHDVDALHDHICVVLVRFFMLNLQQICGTGA